MKIKNNMQDFTNFAIFNGIFLGSCEKAGLDIHTNIEVIEAFEV